MIKRGEMQKNAHNIAWKTERMQTKITAQTPNTQLHLIRPEKWESTINAITKTKKKMKNMVRMHFLKFEGSSLAD
jgi:hypothetical protein